MYVLSDMTVPPKRRGKPGLILVLPDRSRPRGVVDVRCTVGSHRRLQTERAHQRQLFIVQEAIPGMGVHRHFRRHHGIPARHVVVRPCVAPADEVRVEGQGHPGIHV